MASDLKTNKLSDIAGLQPSPLKGEDGLTVKSMSSSASSASTDWKMEASDLDNNKMALPTTPLQHNRFFGKSPETETIPNNAKEPNSLMSGPETETPFTNTRFDNLVGDTPLVDLSSLLPSQTGPVRCRLLAKVEYLNPSFSIKDRIARNIIDKAEMDGSLRKGMTIVAASSGNTGSAVAMIAACRGYECIITTSPKCSKEKMNTIKSYGATLLVSPIGCKEGDKEHYMQMAKRMCLEKPLQYFDIDQYHNLDNPDGHFKTLGPEIVQSTNGLVTHFVAGASTGGTISGTSKFLKSYNKSIKTVLADPIGSIFTKEFYKTSAKPQGLVHSNRKFLVEGVGKGSIPGAMDLKLIDSVIQVSDQVAFDTCRRMCKEEGIFAGGSSGLNVAASIQLAQKLVRGGACKKNRPREVLIVTVPP